MNKFSHLPYRAGVGMMLLNSRGLIFVAKRIDTKVEAWQMPQGGIDAGETPYMAALRELREEVGTDSVTIVAESRECYHYDLPEDLVPSIWQGRYRGQEQKWFVFRLNGDDSLININDGKHPEFSHWKWVPMHDLPNIIVPFKRDLYTKLVTEFAGVVRNEIAV